MKGFSSIDSRALEVRKLWCSARRQDNEAVRSNLLVIFLLYGYFLRGFMKFRPLKAQLRVALYTPMI